ncbi:MAG TPA: NAD-dependent epimerase/dehydratase family protein [Chthoniobacterales bacterium]
MKIVVTGGAGFIGSHVVRRLLDDGHDVAVIDNFTDFYAPAIKRANVDSFDGRARLLEIDIEDFGAVQGALADGKFDVVIHLAARAGVRPSIENPRGYIDTNITGTYNLLEGARAAGTKRFVFASSSSVYGLSKVVPFSEDLPLPQTLSPYAATKLAGEQICGNFSNLYGMRVVCLRFFTVYGPGQRPDLAIHKFTDMIERGQAIPKFGAGETRRDYTYIDDIVQGVLGAVDYTESGAEAFDIFNLGESETTTLNELIAALEASLGKKAVIQQLPEQKGDMPLTSADISKARRLLGYDPHTRIADGIPKFVAWYRSLRN